MVLAAGAGRRFGGGKLSALFRGEPLLNHAIKAALAAPVERVVVVAARGFDIGAWPDPRIERIEIDSPSLSTSLKAGISAVGEMDGAFVFLGDMPLVPHDLATCLAGALDEHFAAQPVHNGKPGHPVLLSRRAFPAIDCLQGDHGAGSLLRSRRDVVRLDVSDNNALLDVDTADDLARLAARDERPLPSARLPQGDPEP